MKAYLGFLLIPLALLLAYAAAHYAPPKASSLALPTVKALAVPVSPDAVPQVVRRAPAQVDLRALMPFDMPAAPAVAVSSGPVAVPFVVSAILVDGDKRVAQIGTEMVQQGDTLAGYKVQRIEPMRGLLVGRGNGAERLWVEMTKG